MPTQIDVLTATSLLRLALLLTGIIWLLCRFNALAQLGLGFLDRYPGGSSRQSYDEQVAVSTLTEQDFLTGLGLHGFKMIWRPLLLIALVVLFAELLTRLAQSASLCSIAPLMAYLSTPVALGALASALCSFIMGSLAGLIMLYLLATLSSGERLGLLPTVGGGIQVTLQVLLFVMGAAIPWAAIPTGIDTLSVATVIALGTPVLIFLCLLLYLARRLDWLRRLVAWALPLVLLLAAIMLFAQITLAGESYEYNAPFFTSFAIVLQTLAVAGPMHWQPALLGQGSGIGDAGSVTGWVYWLWLTGIQLFLLVVFAEFARDAVKRRRWDEGGAG